ncbi:MAG TPA: hypothetical protein VF759_13040 [Allosphingosinicella sp.]
MTDSDRFHNPAWTLSAAETVEVHILGQLSSGGHSFFYSSSLEHALREMNSAGARHNSQFIVPLITAFAILDQVGECYALRSRLDGEPENAIKRSFHHFAPKSEPIDPMEAHALYVLRNGLVHDASLTSFDRRGRNWWVFRMSNHIDRLSIPPRRVWNGKAEDISLETITWVSPERLIDFVNLVRSRLVLAVRRADTDLHVRLQPGAIASRYLLWSSAAHAQSMEQVIAGVGEAVDRRKRRNERMADKIAEYRDDIDRASGGGE